MLGPVIHCGLATVFLFELPHGATAIDLAYHVHSKIGDSAIFAKVNGVTALLSKVLDNGDVVEIVTNPHKKYPSEEWLKTATSPVAKAKIKSGLRVKHRAEK